MSGIAVVTDSTAYIPTRAGQAIQDHRRSPGPDLGGTDLPRRRRHPAGRVLHTAQDRQGHAHDLSGIRGHACRDLREVWCAGHEVLGIFISGKLSGTMQSAIQGREALGAAASKVTLVDSQASAHGPGLSGPRRRQGSQGWGIDGRGHSSWPRKSRTTSASTLPSTRLSSCTGAAASAAPSASSVRRST